jgi:putative acetyltransferase
VTLRIFEEAITVTASADYTPEQIFAWARPGQRDVAEWDQAMRGRNSYIALVEDQVAGFSDVSAEGHIEMLFVSPHFARRGVARKLLRSLERKAQDLSARQLTADVSATARSVFEASGFHVEPEQHLVVHGAAMTNFHMIKALPR